MFPLKLTNTCQDWFPPFEQKKFHSLNLTQIDDGSHFEICHVGFRHCHLRFRHLVILSQIHSKTPSLHSDSDSNSFNLTQTHLFSLNVMMAANLNSAILNLAILDSAILGIFFSNSLTLAKIGSHHLHKKTSLIYFDSTWWWQPSWILSCLIQTLPSWIQTPCYLLSRFTQKHSHLILTLTQTNSIWLKLIHSHSTWWWPANLKFCHLEFGHLGFSHDSISSQSHSHLPRLVATICTKKLHSFILTQLDEGSHLEFCHIGLRHCHLGFWHLLIFSQIHSKKLSLHSDSDSN